MYDDCQTVRQGIFLSWCVCIALFGLVNHFRSNTHIYTIGWRRRRRIPGYVPWAAGANQNWFACIFSQWTDWIIRDPSAKWADQWMLVGNHWERLIYFLCAYDHARLSMAENFHIYVCVFAWLLTMDTLKRNLSKSILIIESWVWSMIETSVSCIGEEKGGTSLMMMIVVSCIFLAIRRSTAGGQRWHFTIIFLLHMWMTMMMISIIQTWWIFFNDTHIYVSIFWVSHQRWN